MMQQQNDIESTDFATLRLTALLERLPAGILVLNDQGKVVESNPAAVKLLGSPLEGEAWVDIVTREMVAGSPLGDSVSLRGGYIVNIATQSLDHVPGQLIMLNDITQLQQLQERLSHYQRLSSMGKMAAQLAHQIRTPLSTALLYAKHLSDPEFYQTQGDNAQLQSLKYAKKIVGRLENIESQVSEMLTFAKGGTVVFETIACDSIIADVQQTMEPRIQAQQAMLVIDSECGDRKLRCNPQVLAGAIENCVNNALEASPVGSKITLTVKEIADNQIEISIVDQGPGIPEELQAKVLEPFFTTRSKGTGLGLAVAKLVAETHGGKFLIASEENRGTSVKFVLPAVKDD